MSRVQMRRACVVMMTRTALGCVVMMTRTATFRVANVDEAGSCLLLFSYWCAAVLVADSVASSKEWGRRRKRATKRKGMTPPNETLAGTECNME